MGLSCQHGESRVTPKRFRCTLAAASNITAHVNRDSADEDLRKAYRRVALTAHPDRGMVVVGTVPAAAGSEAEREKRKRPDVGLSLSERTPSGKSERWGSFRTTTAERILLLVRTH